MSDESAQGSREPVIAAYLLSLLCVLTALLPVSFLWIAAYPVLGVLVAAMVAIYLSVRNSRPRTGHALAAVFFVVLAVHWFFVAWFLSTINLAAFGLSLLAGGIYLASRARFPERIVSYVTVAALFASAVWTSTPSLRLIAFAALVIGVLLIRRGALARTPVALPAATVVTVIAIAQFGAFYYGFADGETTDRIAAQPGVELLVDPRKNNDRGLMGHAAIFAAKDCDGTHLLVGQHDGLWARDLEERHKSSRISEERPGDEVAYQCEVNRVWVGSYTGEALIALDNDLKIVQSIPAPGRHITNIRRFDEELIIGEDLSRDGLIFDLRQQRFLPPIEEMGSRDLVLNRSTGELVGATFFEVRWVDRDSKTREKILRVPSVQIRMDIDAAGENLYVSSYSTGEIWRVDAKTALVLGHRKLQSGVRYVRLLEDPGVLAVGNYAKGTIDFLALPNLEPVMSIEAGRRVRSLHRAPGDHELTWVSRAGAFSFDLDSLPASPSSSDAPSGEK
ncbi:MAG: hypothetical protein H6684_14450 [Deltaproteobacteria bacterium]|nr:hypothetical protein [Deltaproteobacteria bacterium]